MLERHRKPVKHEVGREQKAEIFIDLDESEPENEEKWQSTETIKDPEEPDSSENNSID